MSRRFLQALAAAAAVSTFVASPALAAGTGCHSAPPCTSAVCIYEQQQPSSGACKTKKPAHHPVTKPSTPQQTVTPPPVTPVAPQHPKHAIHKHRKQRTKARTNPRASRVHQVRVTRVAASVSPPSAAAAAFDLGSGPTALFAALLAAAALFAVGGGLHRGRRR